MSREHVQRLGIRLHEDGRRRSHEVHGSIKRLQLLPEVVDGVIAQRDRRQRRLLAGFDCLTALLGLFLVVQVIGDDRMTLATLGAAPIVLLIHKIAGLYDRDHLVLRRSTLDEVPVLVQLSGLYALIVSILEPTLISGGLNNVQVAELWVGTALALPVGRSLARRAGRRLTPRERCLVIGDAAHVERIREKIRASKAHAEVVASLPLGADAASAIGGHETVREVVDALDVQRVVIAPLAGNASVLPELIRTAKAAGVRISVLPRMFEAVGSAMEFETLDGMTVFGVRPFGLSRSTRVLKRSFDLCGAIAGLLVVGPVMAVIAVAIRLDSPGPVFFRQTRIGRDGRPFRMFKFRTMEPDAEDRKAQLAVHNDAGDGFFKITDDPRVTRVGRVLRKTSLDELPQLLNVLRGEMSLVGPRPLVEDEDALVLGLDRSRLHLTPGMTGPWQVLGSSRIPIQEMVGIDYLYVANWTLWGDLKILLRTVQHVFGGGNR